MIRFRLTLVLLLVVVSLAACRRAEVTDVERNPEGGVDVTTRLTESDISEAITASLQIDGNPLLRDPQVDLQSGAIVVSGEHDKRDGSGRVSGSMTITLTAQNGAILAQVTALNIEGLSLNDQGITRFNQQLAADFTRRADRQNRAITVQSITVSDDAVEIVYNVQRR